MTFEVNDEKHAELSSAMVRVEDFIAIEDVDDVCAGWNQKMVRKSVKIRKNSRNVITRPKS